MSLTSCQKKLIHYLRDLDVDITSAENGLGRVVLEWREACQSNIFLKSHQFVVYEEEKAKKLC